MDKDIIKTLIAEYQQEVVDIDLVERPYSIEDTLNYVFVGLRRAGKSYLIFQQIRHLLSKGYSRLLKLEEIENDSLFLWGARQLIFAIN